MTVEADLAEWAEEQRSTRNWVERITKDSKRIDPVTETKLLLNFFTTIVGLDENHAELFLSNKYTRPEEFQDKFKKTVEKVLAFLEESEPVNISETRKLKAKKFFEGFAEAMGDFYTPEEVKEIEMVFTPGGEMSLTTMLTGDRGFEYVHRDTLYGLIKK